MDAHSAKKSGKVTAGRICIDSGSTGDVVEDLVIRDRRLLSEDGFVLAIVTINKLTGMVERQPEVVTRGFAAADLTDDAGASRGANAWKIPAQKKKPITA